MSLVSLPDALTRAIAAEALRLPRETLIHAAQSLSSSYRRKGGELPARLNDAERIAYAAMRMPATYAAVAIALREMHRAVDTSALGHCTDIGAGPGTASFAARATLPSLKTFTQIERDPGWSALAARLNGAMNLTETRLHGDVASATKGPQDLVIAAYVFNELSEAALEPAVRALSAAKILVIVEPGTPQGFAAVRRAREIALEFGAHAAVPCTHNAVCPMSESDWCHRAVRVERSALHRALKLGDLSFEDEKFSYVVITRDPPQRRAAARIVRRPIRAGGHVHLDLCTVDGLSRTTIGRADRTLYKPARDAEWGDLWPPID